MKKDEQLRVAIVSILQTLAALPAGLRASALLTLVMNVITAQSDPVEAATLFVDNLNRAMSDWVSEADKKFPPTLGGIKGH